MPDHPRRKMRTLHVSIPYRLFDTTRGQSTDQRTLMKVALAKYKPCTRRLGSIIQAPYVQPRS